jgi:hypothetical protein
MRQIFFARLEEAAFIFGGTAGKRPVNSAADGRNASLSSLARSLATAAKRAWSALIGAF